MKKVSINDPLVTILDAWCDNLESGGVIQCRGHFGNLAEGRCCALGILHETVDGGSITQVCIRLRNERGIYDVWPWVVQANDIERLTFEDIAWNVREVLIPRVVAADAGMAAV